ncbi:NADH-quinone oxidoreductase subunit NuoG [Glaciimonas sp. Gout2]|uniref:NADH-quinone oxidoreductase subunit NuoG n=1 Tax=unclassified Glaciimonas TaxID=2644401 RepID=UPI002B22590D|nr:MULTISPECIES: NADH-quinone oxidoreductase subunit NuoG [unclassified Glaciimonas]MEB0011925.1 NADH-quinone oxidoreductase subunit NuoG [Glaciimonas sp. Cout2]MEB0082840.1 NADH-quinone oxidoreductase subunit NuoG [Glaciimonas sp. Gout2]
MVEIEIDGKKVEVQEGSMVMDAANKIGTYIPHFCYHKKLSIAANCRMCLVEVEKAPKALPACATPVSAGMIVRTASDKAVTAQKSVMEFLLINHPLDCPICDQGGECQLQDLAVGYGKSSSRYEEEKRVVSPKDAGPLISMQEMTRCIQCTRCVRFGQEIAGVMEFGMVGRGEHSEITTFVGKTVNSELSGNMIDLCPVGALTSKPFRYSARTWELSRRKSISPHDGLGANLIVQVKSGKVMRVLPLENNDVNECWLSDKDRFAYEGLNSAERLTKPMLKQDGKWQEVEWQTALEYVAHGLRNVRHEHGANAIAALGTPYSTLEELSLLQKVVRGLGSENIDFRTRQSDFALDGKVSPWLGMSINEFADLDRAFVIGSFLRKDHPLLSARLRLSVKRGGKLSILHATDDDLLMPVANKIIAAPSAWLAMLGEVVVAVAQAKSIAIPSGFENIAPSASAKQTATSLLSGTSKAVLLGNAAAQHPQASQLHAAAQWIAQQTDARFGYMTEAGNTVGGYLAQAIPAVGKGANAQEMFASPRKAYVLLNVEPELDSFNPQVARAALNQAEMVVVLSAYKHATDYADVLLPIAPFTETSGTFINCEGRAQSFNGTVRPLADARPAWKVLRVLGNLLSLPGFDYDTSEAIRAEVLGTDNLAEANLQSRLNNISDVALQPVSAVIAVSDAIERVADVPIYFSDAVVRRASSLQTTTDAQVPQAWLSATLAQKMGIATGDLIKVKQGQGAASLMAAIDVGLPENVVRIAAGHSSTNALGAMFGSISVEKA